MLKAKRWGPKILRICKRYHFVLLDTFKSIKNEQNMQRYQVITKRARGNDYFGRENRMLFLIVQHKNVHILKRKHNNSTLKIRHLIGLH